MTTAKEKPSFPLFQLYRLEDLERLLPYAAITLVSIRDGHQPPTKRFREVVCNRLDRPEEELFGPQEEQS